MINRLFIRVLCAWVVLLVALPWQVSMAATPPGTSLNEGQEVSASSVVDLEEPGSKAAVRELVSTLSDDAVRALLIQRLDAVAEAKEKAAGETHSILDSAASGFAAYGRYAAFAISNVAEIPGVITKIADSIDKSLAPNSIGKACLILLLAIGLGLCAERLVAFLFRKQKQKLIERVSSELWDILRTIYTRLSFDVAGVAAFSVVSYTVISTQYAKELSGNQLLYVLISGLMGAGFSYVLSRFYFAPNRPDLRICNTTDQRAQQLTISYSILAAYIVVVHNLFYYLLQVGTEDRGEPYAYLAYFGFFLNASMYIAAAATIWYNRAGLTDILLKNKERITLAIGDETPEDVSWFAVNWPKIAIVLLIAKYFLVEVVVNLTDAATYSASAVYITFVFIFLWPGLDATISLFAWKSIAIPDDESPNAATARRRVQQGLLRVGRVLVVGVVLYLLAGLWGVNILGLAESGLGAQAASGLIELLLTGLFAYISWELVSIFVDYWLAQESGGESEEEAGGGEIGGVGLSRTATILPILEKTAKVLIILISIVMTLDHFGVNIGPIIAGAGVLGLAIGFGAQTLVKDIVSGMFFLADDAFRVGEYISVDGTMGNVEKISLRSLRLRHHRGLVHTIPYGEIPKLTNYSRDWVIMKLRFRVPFETDVNKVKKIFKQIGKDLLEHPELGEDFLQPFKSQGVAEVDDNGLVVRGKFMAKPGKQFMIRKEVFVRVQKSLEEAGIPFARKQVIVHIPGMDDGDSEKALTPEDRRVIAAAASEAAEEDLPPDQKEPKPAT